MLKMEWKAMVTYFCSNLLNKNNNFARCTMGQKKITLLELQYSEICFRLVQYEVLARLQCYLIRRAMP